MSTNKSPVSKPPLTNTKKDVSLVDIMNTLKIMRNEIQSINSKLLTQENTSTAILNRMDTLSTEIISLKNENAELKRDIEKLKTNSLEHTCSSNTANSFPGFDFVKEIQEREIKSRNILLFNVVESQDDEMKLATDLIKSLHIDVPSLQLFVLESSRINRDLLESNLSVLKTWLTNDIDSNELGMFDYTVFRNDRNDLNSDRSKGGGVLIAIHNRFCPNVLTLSNASLECLAVSFKSIIHDAINSFIPKIYIHKNQYPQWYSRKLKSLIYNKKRLHKEFKVTKDPLIYNEFSRLRSLCKRESKLINLCYLQKIQSNLTSDPKSFWRYINGLKTNNCILQNMILGDKSSTDGPEVANLFKEFFSSVYSTDKLNIGECLGYSKNYADIYQVQPHIKFTVSEIFDAINSLV
ncbi:hypothetical protein QTP88_001420 [Uroleucon formosanum]